MQKYSHDHIISTYVNNTFTILGINII